ncbi:hypothetical protein SLS53_003339 [Cytospora paraplurivora]|uniref:FAD/NAD(P)-binding domain-containing protein n=1 Tax=Cytospora paraplurivora TaxID=2898453 RepID=A0AAN9YJ93_9PEZI
MAAKPSTTKPPSKVYDVLIVGAGPAGLTVASTIVRQLQTAIVFDTGVYRYGRTNHLYGVPGFDHVEPDTYRLKTRGDILRRYDSVTFKNAYIEEVKRLDNGNFQATDGWLNVYEGRKVVLAAGVKDITPMMEGYDFCWGRGIFNDILYHGLEERGGGSAGLFVFETSSSSDTISQVGSLALQLSKTVRVYTNGNEEAASKIQAISGRPDVQSRITIEERPIRSVYMVSSEASDVLVTLADGTQFKESFIVSKLICD